MHDPAHRLDPIQDLVQAKENALRQQELKDGKLKDKVKRQGEGHLPSEATPAKEEATNVQDQEEWDEPQETSNSPSDEEASEPTFKDDKGGCPMNDPVLYKVKTESQW